MTSLPLLPFAPGAPTARGRAAKPPQHLADLPLAERKALLGDAGEKPFRAAQLSRHYFAEFRDDPSTMTDLPAGDRERLAGAYLPRLLDPVRVVSCDDGATSKTLWRAFDGTLIEGVLMRYPGRATVCVSSQAGCGMACPFCATGQGGLTRNLSTGEIVEQVVGAARSLGGIVAGEQTDADGQGTGLAATDDRRPLGTRVSNVVFMGMGEPLANYRAVSAALRRLIDPAPEGLGLSQRAITVSTVGLVPGILRLLEEKLQVTLALSLHAPDDELRDTLVPINQRYPVAEVLDTAFDYARTTGRRLSIEYALMRGINDQPERADLLAARLRERGRRLVHVNLIPLNPTPGSPWTASTPAAEREFVRRLRDAGVNTTVRDTRGREIAGACGQLAATG
jgi:23S rRNA (adenine2503-C2)-methyltransferase